MPSDYYAPDRNWYKQAMVANTIVVTDAYVDQITDHPCITVATKIKAQDGTVGVIGVDFNLTLLREFLDSAKDKELNGFVNVVDSKGGVVIGSKAEYTTKKIVDVLPYLSPVEKAIHENNREAVKVKDNNKNEWVCFTNSADDLCWYVIYRISGEVFYATQMKNMIESILIRCIIDYYCH